MNRHPRNLPTVPLWSPGSPTRALLALLLLLNAIPACRQEKAGSGMSHLQQRAASSFVGGSRCTACHRKEHDLWNGSHHDLAMDTASERTVLGDFSGATITHFGVTSRFFRRNGKFVVSTEGPDGRIRDYEVAYTFGHTPLQQYLVAFPGGRLQTLPLCWDTRPRNAGGQRWFHIYPNERIGPNDELFWTRAMQNWNYMCADCHSTNLRKNYNVDASAFRTTWSDIDVSCEACHGPGSDHVTWGERVAAGWKPGPHDWNGLAVKLKDPGAGTWMFDPGARTARRTVPSRPMTQVEICAQCHSRRSRIKEEYDHRLPYMETFAPQLLDEGMYHADGQILEEVYEYASFRQSRMYREGVACSDCHEPHSLGVYAPGNALCYRCHKQESYGTRAHHFHRADSTGGSCTGCHMPSTTYMVVDPRLDHSIRIPRPDLTVRFGIPNACTGCHPKRTAQWAADSVARWYPASTARPVHYGEILHAGRLGAPGADGALGTLASDRSQSALVRATALSLLNGSGGRRTMAALDAALTDPDPIVRYGAVKGLEALPPGERFAHGRTALRDTVLGVRLEAVRVLAPVPPLTLTAADNALLDAGVREFEVSARTNGDRSPYWVLLGNVYAGRGNIVRAESLYLRAIALDSLSPLGRVNLVDLYRTVGRDGDGERVLRRGISLNPGVADLHHALGLLLVRGGRGSEGLAALQQAVRLDPRTTRYAFVCAVALHDAGRRQEALRMLEECILHAPYDRDVLQALVGYYREAGLPDRARKHMETLIALSPEDQELRRMYEGLTR